MNKKKKNFEIDDFDIFTRRIQVKIKKTNTGKNNNRATIRVTFLTF